MHIYLKTKFKFIYVVSSVKLFGRASEEEPFGDDYEGDFGG